MPKTKGLYKRGNVWWMRYAGPDGTMRFESSKSATFKVAQGLLLQRKHAVMDGTDPLPARSLPSYSFAELAAQYASWAVRQRAFHTSKKFLLSQLQAFFGPYPLPSVTTRLVEDYQTTLLTQGKAPATVNRHLATLKHMFTKAVEWEMGTEEMLKRVRRVKLLPENNRRLRYLSLEECQALLTACPPHLQPIVLTALHTGMRREEILSLQWAQHVDLRHGFFLLDKTKSGDRREIPINAAVRQTLQGLVRHLESPYVFTDTKGKRFQDVKRGFHSACRRAGITDFTFHDLRHTFASHLVMAGVDLTTVKELLGHKSLSMTLRYAHLAPSHKVKAVAVLDRSLSQTPTIQKLDNTTKKGFAALG